MLHITDKKNCCGCTVCENICPMQCINMIPDEEGFFYPQVDFEKCIKCGKCINCCPANSKNESDKYTGSTFEARNQNNQIRKKSSSGGVFYSIAKKILRENGIVYGAAMSGDCKHVVHIGVQDDKDLIKLQGSKYVQSEMGKTYLEVKENLTSGRKVLFSGTPCQVEGLKAFLDREYDGLLCVDIVCHGVPSQKVWEKYVTELEMKKNSVVKSVNFRDKSYGWRMYSIMLEFSNGKIYKKIFKEDLFGLAFLQNLCLRPSCYACQFKKLNRKSDITLADAWDLSGCSENDDMGTSLVLVHSYKGKKMLDSILEEVDFREVESETAIENHSPIYKSSSENSNRERFFENIDVQPIGELLKIYTDSKKSIRWRARSYYKKICYFLKG